MDIAHELARRGVVSGNAVAHAEAVRRRGFGRASVADLLVDLEYVDERDVAALIAEVASVSVWDGTRDEVDIPTRSKALIVRMDRRRAFYATDDPFDDEQRKNVVFATGAIDAIPLVATRTQMADASSPFDVADVEVPARSELEWRAEWEGRSEAPPERHANVWLLQCVRAPGRVLRARAFDVPEVRLGNMEQTRPIPTWNRTLVESAIYRVAYMARSAPGPGIRNGRILINTPRLHVIAVHVASTPAGESLWCQRVTPYTGVDGIAGTDVGELRAAVHQTEDREQRERILRMVLERADDDAFLLDRLWAFEMLAFQLDESDRELEASVLVEQASELVARHGLGGRADAVFRLIRARNEVSDPERRAALFASASDAWSEPGVGRNSVTDLRHAEIAARLAARDYEGCLPLVQAVVAEDLADHGAMSSYATHATTLGAEALVALGRPDEARVLLGQLDTMRCPGDRWIVEYATALVDAAEGQHRAAIERLERAFDLPSADRVLVAAAWARELLAVGRGNEAIGLARAVEDADVDWFTAPHAAELARIRAMSPYR